MANISPIKNKEGIVTGYRIRVFRYTDPVTKAKKFYTKNWSIPSTYKSEKSILNALSKVVGEFEASCKRGEISDNKQTLSEYCRYYIDIKTLKPSSVRFYNAMLPLIDQEIGMLKLKDLKPEHLDKFYKTLETTDVKNDARAIANNSAIELLESRQELRKNLCKMIGISENTFRECLKKNKIAVKSADKIADFLEKPVKDLFTISTSSIGLSAKSICHYHSFLYSVLEMAVKKGAINRNVAVQATAPKKPKTEAEFFELDEVLKIKTVLDNEPLKYRIATYLLIDTGIRRGELVGIRWKSIDLVNGTIKIENNVQYIEGTGIIEGTPKSNKYRTIHIAPELIPILKEYKDYQKIQAECYYSSVDNIFERKRLIKEYNPEGYLFTQEDGSVMTPSALNSWMIRLSKKVGLHIYPHKFRHSQASLLIAHGTDIVAVSKRLGHAQVSTTMNIYSHLLEKSDENASNTLSNLIFKQAQ